MAGVKALRKIQIGKESTKGTAVAATTIWRGMGTIQDDREVTFVEEDVGYISGIDRTYIAKLGGSITFDEVPATFEQLCYILEAGIIAETPAQDGAGSGYIYDYVFPTTAANTIRTYTIEGGDNTQAEEMEYAFVTGFTLSGKPNEAWTMSADWVGRQVTNTSFTGSLTIPSVEELLFNKSKLYIDDTGGTIGTTQKTSTFLECTINVNTGLMPVQTGDGNLYFTFDKTVMPEITVDVTFEHDGTATAEKTNWRNQTARLLRVLVQGNALSSAGTTYTYKTAQFDFAGRWETFEKIDEQDGNDIIKATLRSRYVVADTLFAEMLIVNELSSLT